jgi:MOSC domain-containing protein YiiM
MLRRRAAQVVAVCTGRSRPIELDGRSGHSAIEKHAVEGPVLLGREGFAGDEQVERRFHGGPDRAAYAYAEEDADHWVAALGVDLPPGALGENLRVRGLDASGARIGERWATSRGVLLEVTGPRIPCWKLSATLSTADMIGRFLAAGRPGAYLRVLVPGELAAGDTLEVVHRTEAPTVAEVMAWRRGEVTTEDLRRLAGDAALVEDLRAWATELLELR